jgi:phenylacetate-CoA ligase
MRFPEIEWFQVVQREFDRLLLRIVSYSGVTYERRAEIVDRIRHHTGFAFQVEFELVRDN